jgi:hypothetical protein
MTVQVFAVLLHAPPQPANIAGGTPPTVFVKLVSTTLVPLAKVATHVNFGQFIPAGELVTAPGPIIETISLAVLGGLVKVADTCCADVIDTMQVPAPVHAPPPTRRSLSKALQLA